VEVARMNIFPLKSDQVEPMWPVLGPFIEKALSYTQGELDPLDICKRALDGEMTIWLVAIEAKVIGVVVTEVIAFAQYDVLRIVTLSGERFKEWKADLDKILVKFAQLIGARRIEAVGRPGWVRALRDLNYQATYVIVTKVLDEQNSSEEVIHEQVGRND